MPRPRFSALVRRPPRILILTVPAALALAAAAFSFLNAHRALTRATASAASAHRIPFTLGPLAPAVGQAAFEPVAATPAYTSGAFFAGNLYLAGPDGLGIFNSDGTPNRTLHTGAELPVAPIAALVQARVRGASEPQLLIATAGAGLLLLQSNGNAAPTLRQLRPADSDVADLTALLPLATGDLLLGTRHRGVLLWNGANLTPLAFTLPGVDPARLQITALAAVDSSSFLIATRDSGLFYAHAGTFQHADSASGLPDNQVESLAVAAGHAYAGTPIGTADFDLSAPSFRPVRTLAAGLFAHALSVQSGTLLVGTLDQGVQNVSLTSRAQLRRASIASAAPSETSQRIDGFLAAPEALFALSDGTLLRREGAVWAPALPPPARALADRNVSALAFAPDGSLYVGFFDHGLDILDPRGNVTHLEDDHLFCVNRLALDPVRQTVAAATANGLVLFDARGVPRQTLTRRDGLLSDHVTDIAFTSTGTALATPAGITFVDPAGTSSLYAFQGLVNNHVYALAARLGSAQLVAGTLGGLSILQSEAVQRNLTVANSGLKHNWVTALLPTPNDTYLVGTYGAGLQTLDREGHFASVELPSGTPRDLIINPNALYATSTHLYAGTLAHGMLVYSNATGRWTQIANGLPSLNVTAFAARQDELVIGTENGLVRIPEANLP
jgi:hypothetical protein